MSAASWLYPMWRFHVWSQGRGETYETIDRKVERGLLTPGVCDCGDPKCPWDAARRHATEQERDDG